MLVLLAESKTMSPQTMEIANNNFINHVPPLEDMADKLMAHVANLSPIEVADILKISVPLSLKTINLAYDFGNKQTGYEALKAFTGEAFQSLDITSFTPNALEKTSNGLRIISSAYGILSPDDIIKPYRLEFDKNIAPGGITPAKYFRQKATVQVVNMIKERGIKEIVNLLPASAEDMLDWKIIRAFSKVYKICFKSISSDGNLKTPTSKKIKEARGLMCRNIFQEDVKSFNMLTNGSEHFIFSPSDSKPGLPVFIVD